MSIQPLLSPRFVRKTQLGPNEYRKDFHQIDREVVAAVASEAADRITPLMSKIYLRLVSAPAQFWEREGVLYFSQADVDGHPIKASKVLYRLLGVASATAHKALSWMHEEGIIGYFAGKNGVGIRIFLNRAARSIGVRTTAAAGKKILGQSGGSSGASGGSRHEPAFNDSFAVLEVLDTESIPPAPESGAEKPKVVQLAPDSRSVTAQKSPQSEGRAGEFQSQGALRVELQVEEIVSRLRQELEPALRQTARQAAALEHERTREWLESRGLPKAARVAQREAYNVLRNYGVLKETAGNSSARGRDGDDEYVSNARKPLSSEELEDLAQACIAMLEVKGQAVELTLSEMSVEGGGFLLVEDVAKVRERAQALRASGGAGTS